ncbi:hypothetical protein D5H75_03990 [Bailinhaonella thermotolerans]|uniref:Uncharacterized protein n=1 Tax=Bailinhaonella thermotolerans TaxID=1070861 RepID=A0A3A4BWH4_9ACTN|nr:hypothetical protein D5H75_03990 [Bailinhaonella thermotolerans]
MGDRRTASAAGGGCEPWLSEDDAGRAWPRAWRAERWRWRRRPAGSPPRPGPPPPPPPRAPPRPPRAWPPHGPPPTVTS